LSISPQWMLPESDRWGPNMSVIASTMNCTSMKFFCGTSPHILPLLEAQVIARLVSPGSERGSGLNNELTGNPLRASLNRYRAGDHLFKLKDILEEALSTRENLFSLRETMC
jgi:hypothetical protein